LTTEDVGVDLVAELLDLLDLPVSHVVLGRVILSNQEHSVVLFPVTLEISVLNDDEIHNVESGEYGA
jgi:hypothetical protein